MTWAFVDSPRLKYFASISGQSDDNEIDIADQRKNTARTNAIIVSKTPQEHQAIQYCDVRVESKGPKRSAKSQYR
jgi:hypothetical protein